MAGSFIVISGFSKRKKRQGQKFQVDVDAWLELQKSGSFYDLNDSINYADLYSVVQNILEAVEQRLNPETHKDKFEEDKSGVPFSRVRRKRVMIKNHLSLV